MQTEHIPLRIENQGDEPVLADRELVAVDLAARGECVRKIYAVATRSACTGLASRMGRLTMAASSASVMSAYHIQL